jgi:hypothetical protein
MENRLMNGIYGHGHSCAHVSRDSCPSMVVTVQNSARVLPASDEYRQQAMTSDYRSQRRDPESNQTRLD